MSAHLVIGGVDLCFYLGALAGVFCGFWLGVGSGYVKGHRVALIDFMRAERLDA